MSDVAVALVRDALIQTAAISSAVADRVFTAYRPGVNLNSLPAIMLSFGEERDISPSFLRTDCLRKAIVTIDCIAVTLKESRSVAELCRKALHGSRGTYRGVSVIEIRVTTNSSEYDIGADANDVQAHITSVQAECTYRAPAVTPTTITDPNAVP